MHILAIDPGNTESGYAVIDALTLKPFDVGKISNTELRDRINNGDFNQVDRVSIEMIKSYGMPVGKDVFETCVWIGRYLEMMIFTITGTVDLVYRGDVKLHHCHSSKAKDSNISQALVDRFASGVRNRGKGTIDAPGWFYGFKADIWQAYALAVYTADTTTVDVPVGVHVREVAL
jgi:hypothetical protein